MTINAKDLSNETISIIISVLRYQEKWLLSIPWLDDFGHGGKLFKFNFISHRQLLIALEKKLDAIHAAKYFDLTGQEVQLTAQETQLIIDSLESTADQLEEQLKSLWHLESHEAGTAFLNEIKNTKLIVEELKNKDLA